MTPLASLLQEASTSGMHASPAFAPSDLTTTLWQSKFYVVLQMGPDIPAFGKPPLTPVSGLCVIFCLLP